jgi:hypothetical protein
MSTLRQFGPLVEILVFLVLGFVFIRRKRTGRWKGPLSFRVAMVLLGLALVLVSLGTVLNHFGL